MLISAGKRGLISTEHGIQNSPKLPRYLHVNADRLGHSWSSHSHTDRNVDIIIAPVFHEGRRLDEAQGERVQREEEEDPVGVREVQKGVAEDILPRKRVPL